MTDEEWERKRCEWIKARKKLEACSGYKTLKDACLDGPWVSPPQIMSHNSTGLVLVAKDFLNFEKAQDKSNHDEILARGYLLNLGFNKVLDCALCIAGLSRKDIYLTQVVHLLPCGKASENHRSKLAACSFNKVTKHEIKGRVVVALGDLAVIHCCDSGARRVFKTIHPSARTEGKRKEKAQKIAKVIRKAERYRRMIERHSSRP